VSSVLFSYDKNLTAAGIQTPDLPARSLVSIPPMLSRLTIIPPRPTKWRVIWEP